MTCPASLPWLLRAGRRALPLAAAALALGLLASLRPGDGVGADGPAAGPAPAPVPAPAPAPGSAPAAGDGAASDPAARLALARGVEQSLVDALAQVRRFTVSVLNKRKDKQGNLQLVGVGSGVIVSRAGKLWVITNVHVTAGADGIAVVPSDGEERVVSTAEQIEKYDFAVLRFDKPPKGLKGVELKPDASQGLAEGAWVLATGNPFFLALDGQPVCTLGCISGTDRILGGEYFYGNAIQHDAEVNPGNSGGPLWNAKGQLIGINGKIATRPGPPGAGPSNTGASFSIPIHQVAAFLDKMLKPEGADPGFLGIDAATHTNDDGNPVGARVTGFQAKSPASAGEKPMVVGDVIESITMGGKPAVKILTANDLTNAVVLHSAGAKVSIRFKRGGKTLAWTGVLGNGK